MAIGHKLGLRLFLEGVEVPIISAQIQIVADSPAAATLQIIATDKALEFVHPIEIKGALKTSFCSECHKVLYE